MGRYALASPTMVSATLGLKPKVCVAYSNECIFKQSTRRRWGCDASLLRAARAGARHFYRARQQQRAARESSDLLRQASCGAGVLHVRGNAAPDPLPSSAQVEQDALKSQPQLRGDFAQGDHKHTDQAVYDASCNVEPAMQSKHGDAHQPRTQSAYAHPRTPMDTVPRSMEEFMSRIIHTVKTSGTRLAVYLRGWDTFRAYSTCSVSEPPACKCCVRNAAKYRGSKEDPPPHRGLVPCLPLP